MSFNNDFSRQMASESGIVDLMADLGDALNVNPNMLFLGGGNPAHIPEFEQIISEHLQSIARDPEALHKLIGVYQSPQGDEQLLGELASHFQGLGWPVTEQNIAITNGSQSAFFMLINLLAGPVEDSTHRKICLPVLPEYLGYADQGITADMFVGHRPLIESIGEHQFKYRCDFDSLVVDESIAALCVSRPTNPTGNVLTDEEMQRLGDLADTHGIPLIVDSAYGDPFPGVMYESAQTQWQKNRIFVMSLSKLGLPGVRTGIVIADTEIIQGLAKVNTIMSLANGNLGPALMTRILKSGALQSICDDVILPFYQRKRALALAEIEQCFAGLNYRVHKSEGAFFLWLWFPELSISSCELYERLKKKNVLVMDGEHFFFGEGENWPHGRECIRITYCAEDDVIRRAIGIIANEVKSLV